MSREAAAGLDDRHPVQRLAWTDAGDGRVTVLVPRYGTGRLGRWFARFLNDPYCRVRLDAYGSFVWKRCDGRRTLREIAAALQHETREPLNDLQIRLRAFLRQMRRGGMIRWTGKPPAAPR
jgi:signal transduction histidine kinase